VVLLQFYESEIRDSWASTKLIVLRDKAIGWNTVSIIGMGINESVENKNRIAKSFNV